MGFHTRSMLRESGPHVSGLLFALLMLLVFASCSQGPSEPEYEKQLDRIEVLMGNWSSGLFEEQSVLQSGSYGSDVPCPLVMMGVPSAVILSSGKRAVCIEPSYLTFSAPESGRGSFMLEGVNDHLSLRNRTAVGAVITYASLRQAEEALHQIRDTLISDPFYEWYGLIVGSDHVERRFMNEITEYDAGGHLSDFSVVFSYSPSSRTELSREEVYSFQRRDREILYSAFSRSLE